MVIWIDNDACPKRVREIVFKAAARLKVELKIVANSYMHPPPGVAAEIICVSDKFDAADNHIADSVSKGDLVITADVPLAARVVEAEAIALSPRGRLFDQESINEQLAMRNLHQELRSAGEIQGGPASFGDSDVKQFSREFDRLLTKLHR